MGHVGFAKMRLGAVILVAGACLVLAWGFGPEPVAIQLSQQAARVESQNYVHRLVSGFQNGARSFVKSQIADEDVRTLLTITNSEKIYRLDLIDENGRVFWSNIPDGIGQTNTPSDLHGALQTGQSFFERINASEAEVSGNPAAVQQPDNGDNQLDREVNHEILPLTLEGKIVGAIERYQDVTTINTAWIDTIRWTFAVIGGLVSFAALFGLLRIHRSSKERMATLKSHAETEGAYLAEQLRVGRELRLLGELNEWLQSSKSLEELYAMVARFMGHLLPDVAGSIYVYSNTRDVLDGGCSWNGGELQPHIHPEDCWGLRRGRTYIYAEGEMTFKCTHAHEEAATDSICIPFLAHGEAVGMMHLRPPDGLGAEAFTKQRKLAHMCAEQISLAIANMRMRDELHNQATRDVLTGLFNRRYLMDRLRRRVERQTDELFAIISIDVDHFKAFNDSYGHEAGDEILRGLGEMLSASCNATEIACRMGGEEFILVLPTLTQDQAVDRAEAVRISANQLCVRHAGIALPQISVSVGIALYSGNGDTPLDVLRRADEALYAAKSAGRNHVAAAELNTVTQTGGVGGPSSNFVAPKYISPIAAE